MTHHNKQTEYTFPASRLATFDTGRITARKNLMRAMLEVDVTEARLLLRSYRRAHKTQASLLAWVLWCVARGVTEYPRVHGLRKGKRGVVVFDEVDISVLVEREVDGEPLPLPVVIRRADEKSVSEIDLEIRQAQQQEIQKNGDYVLGKNNYARWMKLYVLLPAFLRRMAWLVILSKPNLVKAMAGTVAVSSVGMMGQIRGWAIPGSFLPLSLLLGSVVKKPGVAPDGSVTIREYLHLSVSIDHDVVDGAPATRFIRRVVEMLEAGEGL
jgi:pyruvate/2-oxoglutarate dehydrogenase complex dihydrolipoamide acyltransferase (E2) component